VTSHDYVWTAVWLAALGTALPGGADLLPAGLNVPRKPSGPRIEFRPEDPRNIPGTLPR
jgi:hypothetical protein